MAQVVYSEEAFADFERIIEFLLAHGREDAARALTEIRSAIPLLETHPMIGRRVAGELRELVISYGRSGPPTTGMNAELSATAMTDT